MGPVKSHLVAYVRLVRLNRPVGVMLLLWPTLGALVIAADGRPSRALLFTFIAGTFLMRSAGCAFNDYADRDFDRGVERTRGRPVTIGEIGPISAVSCAFLLVALASALTFSLNTLARTLAALALVLAAAYPFTKRFFPIPQAFLGLVYSLGIPMAFASVQGRVPAIGWCLMLANAFWVVAFDTEYAMVDRDDDMSIGIKSAALTFGVFDTRAISCCYAISLSLYLHVGKSLDFDGWYWMGWATALSFAVYHVLLIRKRDRTGCLAAFHHNQWLGFALFAGVALHYLAASTNI
ncbi:MULTISPECIES: 4-hydroxybenzoate octaprenyltransferase [unclassified Caballeronia]|uniref:4-hydroxybenzoate octaprenyltransferase n=1 Tax=unclassified Caballeronia TaxID=2646786 RepID=UPI002541B503|nr:MULTISPECIES: 4-hydroxybenzoate octaprenyltransferase [unclassified Caballeronia]